MPQERNMNPPGVLLRLTVGALLAGLAVIGWRGSTIVLRRRTPDPADSPDNYDLDATRVSFSSRDGTPLIGWWLAPVRPNGATLIICPGHNGSMDGDMGQAAELVRAGFRVLLFDYRAHGASGGSQVTFGAREHLDVAGAINWLEERHNITRVGLVGFSMGAGVALLTAALDERVGAVVADGTINRVSDALLGLGRTKGIPPEAMLLPAWSILITASLRARIWIPEADPIRWVSEANCPVLFVHGADDPFNTMHGVGALAAASPRGQLWLVEGAGHRDAYKRDPEAYYGRVIGFLTRHLG
jgi:pimeloyl-ACP methyl ester carboxylesterase